jgi:hypothetical protein
MTDSTPSAAGSSTEPPAAPAPRRDRAVPFVAAVAAAVVLLMIGGAILYVRGGGPAPPWTSFLRPGSGEVLKPSGPAEVVLRTLRLAGYQRASVGDASGTVVVRIEVPEIRAAADVALTWQTGMAGAATAYPNASRLVVQVFSPTQSLIEVSAPADAVAAAVKADDAAALRKACTVSYISESGGG